MEPTLFVKTFGDYPKIRVLDMLITGRGLDYSISDIAQQAGIGRATFYRLMDQLIKNKIIDVSRKIGHIKLYRLNLGNVQVKEVVRTYDCLIRNASEKEIETQKVKIKVKI